MCEAPVEEDISGSGIDVLDLILNAAADDVQRINRIPDVYDTPRSVLSDSCQGAIYFQVAVGLTVLQLNIATGSENSQDLVVIIARN